MLHEEKIVNYNSDEAASLQTVTGWVSRTGRFWGKDEHMARWEGCTHTPCKECGTPISKNGWTICPSCREKKELAQFEARERQEWDGTTPLYSYAADKYFFDTDDLAYFIEEEGLNIENMRLVICTPNYAQEVDGSQWADDLPEDGEFPNEMMDAIAAMNEVIRKLPPLSWSPGKYAATIKSVQERLT